MAVPRPEHPRPDFKRENWLNLNGRWRFHTPRHAGRKKERGPTEEFSREIVVPFPPESELSGIRETGFMEEVWYKRNFKIPRNWSGNRVLLHFGAVDYEAEVWVNGRKVGSHKGGYTPFSFDVTDSISFEKRNEVVVAARDGNRSGLQASGKQSPRLKSFGCYYTRVTGIWQTVWLEAVPKTYVRYFRFLPSHDGAKVYVEIKLGGKKELANAKATISLEGREVASSRLLRTEPPTLSLETDGLKAWNPEDPILYDVRLEVMGESGDTDSVDSCLGLRRVEVKGNSILLNGRKRFLRLVLDQGYYPDGVYTAPSDEALRKDIELAKEMGFDGARLHQKVFEPRFLYWADKLGYLVTGEYADWGCDLSNPKAREDFFDGWIEAVERDLNHPSLVIWTPFNERVFKKSDKDVVDFVRRVVKVTKLIDPTRPVIDSSGYVHVETDIFDVHDYEQDPEVFRSHYERFGETGSSTDLWVNFREESAEYSGQPVMVSEYGGTWWNPGNPKDRKAWGYGKRPSTAEEFLARYESLTETLLSNPRISAFCYTQLYDIEQEVNGLSSYERRAKFDVETIRKINAQAAAIEVRP
ncbi:MAG: beta-galactosidase [Candidatus Brockarchaeota archaeon]|nr:beta-galactosidase [Candidatus Brockarchaeota archaeon]